MYRFSEQSDKPVVNRMAVDYRFIRLFTKTVHLPSVHNL